MTRHSLLAATLVAVSVFAIPALAEENDDDYTYAEFQDDCELAGGEAVFTTGTAACDFDEGEDIVCSAGGGTVKDDCALGEVTSRLGRRPNLNGATTLAPVAGTSRTNFGRTGFQMQPMQLR